MRILNAFLAFTVLCLPSAIITGLCGALLRRKVAGHPREELIVKGSMLGLSIILVFLTIKVLGG